MNVQTAIASLVNYGLATGLIGDEDAFSRVDIFYWKPGDERERATSYLRNGMDEYRYTGDRDDLTDAVEHRKYEHYATKYDWN